MPSFSPTSPLVDESPLPISYMREEIAFLRALPLLKDGTDARVAVLNGDFELAQGILPPGASISVAYSLGAVSGMCMEIFCHPDVERPLAVTTLARVLAATLTGEDCLTATLVQGASGESMKIIKAELHQMLGASERFDVIARLVRRAVALGSSLVILPEDSPLPLACAALRGFPIVVTPRSFFDEEFGSHVHVFVRGDIFTRTNPSAWRMLHSTLAQLVGNRTQADIDRGDGSPSVTEPERADTVRSGRSKSRQSYSRRPSERCDRQGVAARASVGSGKSDSIDRVAETERIAKLEEKLRAQGLIL